MTDSTVNARSLPDSTASRDLGLLFNALSLGRPSHNFD